MIDHSGMKLGRKHVDPDHRVPRLSDHMSMQIPAPSVDWTKAVKSWNCLGNDTIGLCTAAASFHIAQSWRCNNGFDFQPSTAQAIALYSATSDYPKADNGAVESRVLAYWSETGIPNDVGIERIAFAALDPLNLNEIKLSIQYLGAAYIGVNLPISAQTQSVWDVPAGGAVGVGAAGSWGGHALPILAYDETGFVTITWGKVMRMTNAFMQAYCVEAYGLVSNDWLANSGISPPGLNYAALQAEMAAITL